MTENSRAPVAEGKSPLPVLDAQIAMFDPEMPPHDGGRPLAKSAR